MPKYTGGTSLYPLTSDGTNLTLASGGLIFGTTSGLYNDAANVLAQRNGTNAQVFRVYNTFTDASNYERGALKWATNVFTLDAGEAAGTGSGRQLELRGTRVLLGTTSLGANSWQLETTGHLLAVTDNTYDIGASGASRPRSIYPASPAITSGSGTGLTVNNSGELRRVVHKVTVTYAALAAAGLTADKTIATLPAKTRLVGILADTTTPYTGGGVTAATLIVGKTTGGNEYLVSHDVLTATILVGDADADLGTSINRASAIQGGDLASWTGTTAVSVRLTTVTANTNQLTAGSTTYYLITEGMP